MGRFLNRHRCSSRWALLAACGWMSLSLFSSARADGPTSRPAAAPDERASQPAVTTLEPIVVTAERREQSEQDVPASVTAIDAATIQDAHIENVHDASRYVPNLYVSQFSSPRTSFPYIRGIGGGQNSPGVTTYIDGVPQLSYSTSNIELVDVDRMEFLRGPQSTLYGRSALGGVINIYSEQPGNSFEGDGQFTGGNYSLQDYRGGIRGPLLKDQAFVAVSGGYVNRQGFTTNLIDNEPLDGVNELFGRVEFRFTPTEHWDLRITANAEHDHDGDFPIADVAFLHQNPWRVDHDYTGMAGRDVAQLAFTAIYHGNDADFTSVSAVQHWREQENTDLDETAFNGARRFNHESQMNYIEEARLQSPTDKPVVLNDNVKFSWLVGSLLFVTNDHQSINDQVESPLLSGGLPVPLDNFQNASTDTYGIGVYGQGTLTFWNKLDATAGARVDYEYNSARINDFSNSTFVPATAYNLSRDDVQVSPQFSADYHLSKEVMPYATIARGFRPGGFNPVAPSSSEVSFGPERSWSYEAGVKTSWLDNHLLFNADAFYIDWTHMQLNVPTGQPSQFFIDNVGKSHSTGCEAELTARVLTGLDFFAGFGFTNARFDRYTQTDGVSARGNRLPEAPETTWNVGAQYGMVLGRGLRAYVRGEVIGFGPMAYDSTNALEQGAYTLTNFRLGVGADHWRIEGFINNALDTHYIPIAYPFPGSASGYVGQEGDPLTMGVTLGVTF